MIDVNGHLNSFRDDWPVQMIKVFSNAKYPYTAYFSEQVKLADKKVILSLAGFSLKN